MTILVFFVVASAASNTRTMCPKIYADGTMHSRLRRHRHPPRPFSAKREKEPSGHAWGVLRAQSNVWDNKEACCSRNATTDSSKTPPTTEVSATERHNHNDAALFAAAVVAHVAVLGPVSVSPPPSMRNSGGSPEARESQCTSPLERVTVVSPVRGRTMALSSSQSPLKTKDHQQQAFAAEGPGSTSLAVTGYDASSAREGTVVVVMVVLLRCLWGVYHLHAVQP